MQATLYQPNEFSGVSFSSFIAVFFYLQSVWIPTGMPHQRVHLLKPKHLLSALEDEEENVFFTGIEDRR
jgi:hypothetical protein